MKLKDENNSYFKNYQNNHYFNSFFQAGHL